MNIIKTLSAIILRGLPENYFRQCHQAWQRCWNTVSQEEYFEGGHTHYLVSLPTRAGKKTRQNMQPPFFFALYFSILLHMI
jgi:hypothetical protein